MKLLLNLGLFVSSVTTAAAVAAVDPHAAEELSAADQLQFEKENASNGKLIDDAISSSMFAQVDAKLAALESELAATKAELTAVKSKYATMESEHATTKAEHAAELTAVKSEMKSKVADLKATIASFKARRHGAAPSSLRRRTTQEFSMSTPAIANIAQEEQAFWGSFNGWDDHHESCCDRVAVLEGKVSKLEDDVEGLMECVDYQELYSPDGASPSRPTCKIGLGKDYVIIDGKYRVTTSAFDMNEANEGRVTINARTVMVDAKDSVTVKAMTTATVDAHDIVLDSKNDIMAHAMNNIQIKAKEDVEITADANGGSEGNVKISGENVHVDAQKNVMVGAGDNVTAMAGDNVHVDAVDDVKISGDDIHVGAKTSVTVKANEDVNVHAEDTVIVKSNGDIALHANNSTGEVYAGGSIEGYGIVKRITGGGGSTPLPLNSSSEDEVCSGGYGTSLEVSAVLEDPSGVFEATDTLTASLDFGVVEVNNGENLLVNVMVQSMVIYGYDEEVDDDFDSDFFGDVEANVALYTGPGNATKIESVFPGGLTMTHVGVFGLDRPLWTDDNGNPGGIQFESVNDGKFFFPELSSGTYLLRVEFDLNATQVHDHEDDSHDGTSYLNVMIGEHLISVSKAVNKGQCNLQVET